MTFTVFWRTFPGAIGAQSTKYIARLFRDTLLRACADRAPAEKHLPRLRACLRGRFPSSPAAATSLDHEEERHRIPARHVSARPEHLDVSPGARSLGRYRRTRRLSVEQAARLHRTTDCLAALADRAPLRCRRARRLRPAPA